MNTFFAKCYWESNANPKQHGICRLIFDVQGTCAQMIEHQLYTKLWENFGYDISVSVLDIKKL